MAWYLVAAAVAACALSQDTPLQPAQILDEVLAASKGNNKRAVNWLGQEDIRRYDIRRGKRRLTSWLTYEASKVEGENYFRLVAKNGKPLSKQEAARERVKLDSEAARRRSAPPGQRHVATVGYRYSMSIKQIRDHHALQLSGEDTVDGRKVWIIDTRLRDFSPEPATNADMALAGNSTLWVDQATKLVVMQELRFTRNWGQWGPGSMVRYELEWNGEVMLVRRIFVHLEHTQVENEQVYTQYRKFSSEATVTFDPSDPPLR